MTREGTTRGGAATRMAGAIALLGAAGLWDGCASDGASPPPAAVLETPMKVARVDRGEIISVRDVSIEPAVAGRVVGTSAKGPMSATRPTPPARRPSLLGIPMTPGPQLVPGEEIMVRLNNGQYVLVVQERSSPAMARGEPVRVVTEVAETGIGAERTRVVRQYQ